MLSYVSMTLSQLRHKHPRLIYRDFKVKQDEKNLQISFNFLLEPDIVFTPEILIPVMNRESRPGVGAPAIKNLAFHLGLVEAINYWKAACPPELVVEAGYLSPDQIAWWRYLFIHGLGEFFYRNRIDFTTPDFLTIRSTQRSNLCSLQRLDLNGDLILVGGGKDSIVTMETLKEISETKNVLMVNPGPNSISAVSLAGYQDPIVITRKIDPALLQLNKQGYLNGHTPFSAYLAFLGVFVAKLHGYKNVISSNELSAGEASLIYKSMEINHQYSKSFIFEKKFRDYSRRYLTDKVEYFSFLRPLYELQIAKQFSRLTKYDSAFTSCNVGRGKFWCGQCPKCAFSYLSLFPFMDSDRLNRIFGRDLFEVPEIQNHILDLVGLGGYKPFDCVGTKDESVLAAALAIKKTKNQQEFLISLEQKLNLNDQESVKKLEGRIMENWSDQNFLPSEYSTILNRRLLAKPGVS